MISNRLESFRKLVMSLGQTQVDNVPLPQAAQVRRQSPDVFVRLIYWQWQSFLQSVSRSIWVSDDGAAYAHLDFFHLEALLFGRTNSYCPVEAIVSCLGQRQSGK